METKNTGSGLSLLLHENNYPKDDPSVIGNFYNFLLLSFSIIITNYYQLHDVINYDAAWHPDFITQTLFKPFFRYSRRNNGTSS